MTLLTGYSLVARASHSTFSHVFAARAHCLLLSFLRADYFMRLFAVLCSALLCSAMLCCVAQCCPLPCRAVLPRVVLSLHTSTVRCQSSRSSRQPSTATAPGDPALHTLHSALCTSHKSQSALKAAATTTAAPPAAGTEAGRVRGAEVGTKRKQSCIVVGAEENEIQIACQVFVAD